MTNAIYNPLLSQYFPPKKKHKGRDRGANSRGGAYFKFWLSLRRGAYSKAVLIQGGGGGGGTYWRIYGAWVQGSQFFTFLVGSLSASVSYVLPMRP